jgi:hypothetical protein
MKKKIEIKYPLCYQNIKNKVHKDYIHHLFRENKYYGDNKFFPSTFYKPIVKL